MIDLNFCNFQSGISFQLNNKCFHTIDGYISDVYFDKNKKQNTDIRKCLFETSDGEILVFVYPDRVYNKLKDYDLKGVNVGVVFSINIYSNESYYVNNLNIEKLIFDDNIQKTIYQHSYSDSKQLFDNRPKTQDDIFNKNKTYLDDLNYYIETILNGDNKRFKDNISNLNSDVINSFKDILNKINSIV